MPKTSYITMDGDLVSEINPTSRLDYKRDSLGSVTGTAGPDSATENQYRYKPYGALLSQSGTGRSPLFQWVGSKGYRSMARAHSDVYIRARHFSTVEGRWTSVDPLWPAQPPYSYCAGAATTAVDPLGTRSVLHINSFISRAMPQTTINICGSGPQGGWISAPPNLAAINYVLGDNRTFFQKGTSRIRLALAFDECSIGALNFPQYTLGSDLSSGARTFTAGYCYTLVTGRPEPYGRVIITSEFSGPFSGVTNLRIQYSGSDPLIPFAPDIQMYADVSLSIDKCSGRVSVSAQSSETAFPWHEAYVTSSSGLDPVFTFTPRVLSFFQLLFWANSSGTAAYRTSPCLHCKKCN